MTSVWHSVHLLSVGIPENLPSSLNVWQLSHDIPAVSNMYFMTELKRLFFSFI